MAEPVVLESKPLEELINQPQANFNPVMSADGNTLIYSTEEKFYDAVWMVRKTGNRWKTPVNIRHMLQSDGNVYPTSITGDGMYLYLVKMTNFGSDIYVSVFERQVWSPIEKLSKKINSKFFETHAAISNDGNTLYFTSNRKGGFGGLDIYVSVKDDKGNWQDPVNIGNTVNTQFNETTPFILNDNKTLFFSSQGHETMGGFDIFKSTRLEDSTWS